MTKWHQLFGWVKPWNKNMTVVFYSQSFQVCKFLDANCWWFVVVTQLMSSRVFIYYILSFFIWTYISINSIQKGFVAILLADKKVATGAWKPNPKWLVGCYLWRRRLMMHPQSRRRLGTWKMAATSKAQSCFASVSVHRYYVCTEQNEWYDTDRMNCREQLPQLLPSGLVKWTFDCLWQVNLVRLIWDSVSVFMISADAKHQILYIIT